MVIYKEEELEKEGVKEEEESIEEEGEEESIKKRTDTVKVWVESYTKMLPNFIAHGNISYPKPPIKPPTKIYIHVQEDLSKIKELLKQGKSLWLEYAKKRFFYKVETTLFDSEASFTAYLDNKKISPGKFVIIWEEKVRELAGKI